MLAMTSCMNDWDTEQISTNQFTASSIGEANTSLSDLRKDYATEIENSSYKKVDSAAVIEGIVVANDISGNIYQYIYIQGINADGSLNTEEGGVAVGVKGLGALYTIFPVGQKIRVDLKDLYVGGYGKSPRIGMPYINTNGAMRMGPMTFAMMQQHIQKVGEPQPEIVVPRTITASELTESNIDKLTPMLVQINNAEISDAGWPYAHWEVGGDTYSEYHDIKADGSTLKQLLYTSTSCTFAGDTIQAGKKNIKGLLNRYSSSYQLTLRSLDDVIELGK